MSFIAPGVDAQCKFQKFKIQTDYDSIYIFANETVFGLKALWYSILFLFSYNWSFDILCAEQGY